MEFMVRDNILHKNGRCNMEIVLGLKLSYTCY